MSSHYLEAMLEDLAPIQSALLVYISGTLLFIVLWIIILWAIIRGAVLSALRKHDEEKRARDRSVRVVAPSA